MRYKVLEIINKYPNLTHPEILIEILTVYFNHIANKEIKYDVDLLQMIKLRMILILIHQYQ
ncbi:hypothetical protein BCR32DRAFT_276324 [Anaeromyces robustus]|uniref:Uncharacterized protein n=1 Tax=Anaeromyces robustus TaxID=1754192 RepID=A0A1Y1XI59_9FUNG|nr:hypothetical protein BCR32DRAFT_287922 [Anaeromyces robustus]ORX85423.1 hypothetical protein BCR32DRAFT_276324 [Anaeromyces robustus]|eukprot:ORX63253.1 hypothetical protein BCR32DRAFT_287922 [Anaeromyces robustus]